MQINNPSSAIIEVQNTINTVEKQTILSLDELPTATTLTSADTFLISRESTLFKITKQTLETNLLPQNSNTAIVGNSILNTILYRDSNWILSNRVNRFVGRESLMWTSFGSEDTGRDSLQGKIQIGYITLRDKLHLLIAGGGQTEPSLKFIRFYDSQNNSLLLTRLLSQLITLDSNNLVHSIIDTSTINGKTVYLEFQDSAVAAYGWIAFAPTMFVE